MAPAPRPATSRRLTSPTHALALLFLSAATLFLTACGSFFSCEGKASCPCATGVTSTTTNPCTGGTGTGGSGSSSTDYAYVTNSTTSATDVNGYNLGAGTLATATSSPFSFGYSPIAMAANPADTFLYAASDSALSTGYIYGYSIGTGGALSILGGGSPEIEENDASLAISPDGQWLFTLPITTLVGANLINVYPINSSTGALGSLQTDLPLAAAPTGTITPIAVAVAPTGEYVAAALASGGANVFPFTTSTGEQTAGQSGVVINPGSSSNGVYALAFDSNNYLYCATTNGLVVFSVASGTSTPTVTALQTYATGTSSRSIAIASTTADSVTTPNYVYVGDEVTGKIYGFSIGTNAALTAISGSPFTAPPNVNSLAVDSTGKYLIASGFSASTGTILYTIGTGGALTSTATAGTGSSTIPGAIAATH